MRSGEVGGGRGRSWEIEQQRAYRLGLAVLRGRVERGQAGVAAGVGVGVMAGEEGGQEIGGGVGGGGGAGRRDPEEQGASVMQRGGVDVGSEAEAEADAVEVRRALTAVAAVVVGGPRREEARRAPAEVRHVEAAHPARAVL